MKYIKVKVNEFNKFDHANILKMVPGIGTAPLLHFPKVACYYYTIPEKYTRRINSIKFTAFTY